MAHRALRSVFLLFLLLGNAACDFSGGKPESTTPALKIGAPLFVVDPSQVSELTIAKSDPLAGDAWTARVAREGATWKITSTPDGRELIDRLADGNWIDHFLDTLTTLRASSLAPNGPLTSYGLAPPVYGLRWSSRDGKVSELQLGEIRDAGRFARVASLANSPVVVAEGAALAVLGHLTSFEALRKKALIPFTSDEVDELELYRGKKPFFYAQREGGDWTDRKHKPVRYQDQPVSALVEKLTHLRVDQFVDDRAKANGQRTEVQKAPLFQVVFKDRTGHPTQLQIGAGSTTGALVAWLSARPDTVFILFPETARIFTVQH